jgi:hypothetical protein
MQQNKILSLDRSYHKTILTIKSCQTLEQLEVASRMVKNFEKLYKKVGYPKSISYKFNRELNIKMGSLSNTH